MIRYIENDSIMKPVKQQAKVKSIFKTPPPTRLSAFNTLPKASASHPGLMIFDLHASHRTEDVIKCLAKRGWHCVFVPGGSTGDVQIMDTHVNRPFKHMIRELYESEHGEDDLSDEDGVEVLSPDEVPEKRIRKSHQTLSVQCSRIDKVWKQMKPHVVKGFEANVLPLLSAAPPAADSEEEIQKAAVLAEKTQIEQEIVDRFLGTCVSADTFQSLVADINSIGNEEPNPESTTLEQLIKLKHMNLYADDDNAQDEDGEAKVDYLETTLLALEKRCGYCSDPLEASGALIECKICGGSSHQFCVTQSQGYNGESLCRSCKRSKERFVKCVFCGKRDDQLTRCGQKGCPFVIHFKCAVENAKENKIHVNFANTCAVHAVLLTKALQEDQRSAE